MLEYLHGAALLEQIQQVSRGAIASGALQKISTQQTSLVENTHHYSIRVVDSLKRKPAAAQRLIQRNIEQRIEQRIEQQPVTFNPFLPYEQALYVGELSQTHRCLLNKFQVVDRHILLVTNEFRDQREKLTIDDFFVAAIALQAQPSLVFFNGGREAGASVKHKHLQAIPLAENVRLPLIDSLRHSIACRELLLPQLVPDLPFQMAICKLSMEQELQQFARQCLETYIELLVLLKMEYLDSGWMPAYNLLLLDDMMCLVPRRQEAFAGLAVNALGYAGAVLVKSAEQLIQLKQLGVEQLLTQVGYAR